MMIDEFFKAYIECAIFCDVNDAAGVLADPLKSEEIAPETRERMRRDCARFIVRAGSLLDRVSDEQAGHDFWMTRNQHGGGFWSRGLGEVGDRLTEIARGFGVCNLYRGDDGLIHLT